MRVEFEMGRVKNGIREESVSEEKAKEKLIHYEEDMNFLPFSDEEAGDKNRMTIVLLGFYHHLTL